jgi:hypothetical protein
MEMGGRREHTFHTPAYPSPMAATRVGEKKKIWHTKDKAVRTNPLVNVSRGRRKDEG